ncbi:hypothetical protein OIE62_07815 [Streptomyces scopuliridis]|uniref:Uncharacterized protein n=1 Tax=Streptomyces scopuliridis TaxID=452529 RepID=A0ACD4ZT03_9ACTN|nr:hypothetical protein [Streptomyces scopuliridis]WSC01529.1 hypothetical protein OG835_34005 [Streptomyces scopuliridis]WSC04933.1 hypothetical protein OIE62_07815 [Streptomyces scopuliridis]
MEEQGTPLGAVGRCAGPGSGWFLAVSPVDLFIAAHEAGLPVAHEQSEDDERRQKVHDNATAVVLAAQAVLAARGWGHRAGGPRIGEAVGSLTGLSMASLEITLRCLMQGRPEGFKRLLFHCETVTECVDLRTVAALAHSTPHVLRPTALWTNPTGHGPEPTRYESWVPMTEFVRSVWRSRNSREQHE